MKSYFADSDLGNQVLVKPDGDLKISFENMINF